MLKSPTAPVKSLTAPGLRTARSRTMGTGLMKSPTPTFYGDVPSLSPPVDWIMPNEDAEVVWLHTSSLQYPFIICNSLLFTLKGNFVA